MKVPIKSDDMNHHSIIANAMNVIKNPVRMINRPRINRQRFAGGGMPPPVAAGQEPARSGPLASAVAGRTDHLMIDVPEGAYVIPADVVSHWGENNTQSGLEILDKVFSGRAVESLRSMAASGGRDHTPRVPIAAAGGEYVVPPESVRRIGQGDLKAGHKILDSLVKKTRKEHIKTLSKLPGPKQ